MRKFKILFFSTNEVGGNKTFIEHVKKMDNKRITVVFHITQKGLFVKSGGKTEFLYIKYTNLKYLFHRQLFLFVKELVNTHKAISRIKPDLLFSINLFSALNVFIARIFYKKTPFICYINTNLYQLIQKKDFFLYRLLLLGISRFVFNKADKVIFISYSLSLELQKRFNLKRDRCLVISEGVNIARIQELAKDETLARNLSLLKKGRLNIVSIGRFEKQKDFVTLIRSFQIVSKKITSAQLYLIGEGSLKGNLTLEAKKLNINKKVHFMGWKNNVYPYLKYADLFVYSSNFDGLGYVILEAMALKKPVISTDTPFGPSEILDRGKYGILTPVGNYQELARKIIGLLSHKSLIKKYSELSFKRVQNYNTDNNIRAFERLFLSCADTLPIT